MIGVLREAGALVSRPGNDFLWSSWEDGAAARREIDAHVDALRSGPVRSGALSSLFAPTGPLQEVALSSGWGDELVALASRFDAIEMVAGGAWRCGLCGGAAGSVEARENGDVRREGATGVLTMRVTEPEAFGRLWDAIVAGSAPGVFAVDAELAPWWCPECAASYCGAHWDRWDVFDADVPAHHDSIRGRCPRGHERMLED
jgi:hypothetical protein